MAIFIYKVFLIFCRRAYLLLFLRLWLLCFHNWACRRLTQQSSWALFCFKFATHIQWADPIFKIWENGLAELITSNSICCVSTIFQLLVHRATFPVSFDFFRFGIGNLVWTDFLLASFLFCFYLYKRVCIWWRYFCEWFVHVRQLLFQCKKRLRIVNLVRDPFYFVYQLSTNCSCGSI